MKPQVKSFLEKLNNDTAFKERFRSASKQERQQILAGFLNGISFEEFKNEIVKGVESAHLKFDELGNVSGGGFFGRGLGYLLSSAISFFLPDFSKRIGNDAEKSGNIGDIVGEKICDFVKN